MNLVFIGPSGSGKSTMLGHLIAESGAIETCTQRRSKVWVQVMSGRWVIQDAWGQGLFIFSYLVLGSRCSFGPADSGDLSGTVGLQGHGKPPTHFPRSTGSRWKLDGIGWMP